MKETGWIPGEWRAVCDICGFEFLASELKQNWKKQRVCEKDFETRHPQEFVRPRKEPISVPWTRPTGETYYTPVQFINNQGWVIPLAYSLGDNADFYNG